MFHRSHALFAALASLFLGVVASGAASCSADSSSAASGASAAGSGGGASSSTTTGGGDATATTSSASTGGGGGGTPAECVTSADCVGHPGGPVCEPAQGICVPCTPAEDVCPMGQYCTAQAECLPGCTDDSDCLPGTACDVDSNACVDCVDDTQCVAGAICVNTVCVPGCNPNHACTPGLSCCGSTCFDLSSDVNNCGGCNAPCPEPAYTTATCSGSQCGIVCLQHHADCNLDPSDGCERNTLQDGPCDCVPGDTQSCYSGEPGTLGVGLCKAGTQTCDATASWGPCVGQVMPIPELCNGLDDDCTGLPEIAGCVGCLPNTGSCNGQVGTWCKDDGLGYQTEVCDPLQNTTCNPQTGKCDGACGLSVLGSSYIGCDYYPTVTANLVAATFHFAVAVSNTAATPATVTITKGAATISTTTVQGGSVAVITMPWENTLKGPSSSSVVPFPASVKVVDGAYRLRSNQPVTVYQFNPLEYAIGNTFSYSNDASILLPVNVWTGKYRVAARHHFAGGSGFYAVTAKEDGTTVTVTAGPNGGIVKSGAAGIATTGNGTIVLDQGDVLEVVTNGGAAQNDPNDVTGTLVSADKPVQVIGGHQCVYIPYNVGYCDHIEESMFPFETLSNEYIVAAPLIPTGGQVAKVEMVRVVATADNTTLVYDPPQAGAPATIAQAGAWIELADNAGDFSITANQPILVVQYMEGQDAGGASGDPSMTLAVPKDQYRTDYLFHAPTNYTYSYVNITAPTGASVTIDGAAVGGFVAIGNTGYSVARVALSNAGTGDHQAAGDVPFGISVYGYGQYTSYWYPGGSNLIKLHN